MGAAPSASFRRESPDRWQDGGEAWVIADYNGEEGGRVLYLEILLRQPGVRAALLFVLAAGLVVLAVAPRPRRWALARIVWSVGLVVSVTTFSPDVAGTVSGRWQCELELGITTLHVLTTTEGWLNVILFAPLGFFFSRLANSWASGAGAGLALSLMVEVWQGARADTHVCSVDDLTFNAAGALIGSLLARALRGAADRHSQDAAVSEQ